MRSKARGKWTCLVSIVPILLLLLAAGPARAVLTQCPPGATWISPGQAGTGNVVCMHITGGDGFTYMGDGYEQYLLSFGHVTPGVPDAQVLANYTLKATFPAPTIVLKEGQELYLTMTNVGMTMRPDLFDPHSVHWHGFKNAAPIFDGLPEPSPTANMGASFTYYYKARHPGTFFYHCHVEAAEHMQMGMIGNLWVLPAQNELPDSTVFPNGFIHIQGNKYAYNDGDGSTYYDREFAVQLTGFDPAFHDASLFVQPLPFAAMEDKYPMINGRGYPDTINPNPILNRDGFAAQPMHARISANAGEKILLRVSNISTTDFFTITTTLGVPMKVVGNGAQILRSPTGQDLSYETFILNTAGGEHYDVILNTAGVPQGTYFLYTTDLKFLSNNQQERGGLMTEIVIN
ncbi:multicopper oxidase domain-containing protein [Desulfoferrobacter suflitae]|uniref:multicopper oxidase domain-containing protein n=1 Tax=Desulfoferrobacter suflitae TaxID=2865782 RepID=UPI0021649A3E|nr:multicopper oxidase domain-containing protein [Desulfoferrobacter suflitae]MCK8600803.1 multicopper oxidase domain-containing protein [Desulfoferrobacter suflitae]